MWTSNYDQVNDFQYCRKDGKTEVLLQYDEIVFPFFPVVGNHDITRNGWALWSTSSILLSTRSM